MHWSTQRCDPYPRVVICRRGAVHSVPQLCAHAKESRRKMNPCDTNSIKFRARFRNEMAQKRLYKLRTNRGRRARNGPLYSLTVPFGAGPGGIDHIATNTASPSLMNMTFPHCSQTTLKYLGGFSATAPAEALALSNCSCVTIAAIAAFAASSFAVLSR